MPLVDETHNEIDRDIYYNKIELKILKSINKINQEIFSIQESIIEYEQFGQKEINDFKPFLRNYPFQFSFDEFSPTNYWGCHADEEYLNNPPSRIDEYLNKLEFFSVMTGGGCWGFENNFEKFSILITDGNAQKPFNFDQKICVTVTDDDSNILFCNWDDENNELYNLKVCDVNKEVIEKIVSIVKEKI
tara:strand:- start:382 stop:948 length:567 start_codon:yes stop_codon:yes gene_type:complete